MKGVAPAFDKQAGRVDHDLLFRQTSEAAITGWMASCRR